MKVLLTALLAGGSMLASQAALAQAMNKDDVRWINQCIDDNKGEGAAPTVVRAYCVCMNEQMDDNETRSITQWEKANPAARAACDKQAGWR